MTSKTLTRADLTEALHVEVGLTRQDCAGLVERTLGLVADAMERGEIVKLSGFGVFQVRAKRERVTDVDVQRRDVPHREHRQLHGRVVVAPEPIAHPAARWIDVAGDAR